MHDPMTVIRDWPKYNSLLYRLIGTQLTLWHVDPESDGTDDSCGWFAPKLTKEQRGNLDFDAGEEAKHPWFQREMAKQPQNVADTEHLLRGAILHTAHMVGCKCSYAQATDAAARLLHNPVDNIRSSMCFAPGYHSNNKEATEYDRKYHANHLYHCIARYLLREARPWYKHPRWHVMHWRLQIHLWQKFKRAWLEKCVKCGKGYSWGYCPTGSWSGKDTWHSDCKNPKSNNCQAASP